MLPRRRRQTDPMRARAVVALLAVVALTSGACGDDDGGAPPTTVAERATPTVGDHWHSAYGVEICGEALGPFASDNDPEGIHSHADGIIHIHPFSEAAGGANANLGAFFSAMGAGLSDDSLELGEAGTFTEGEDECDGEPGIVQVARWSDASRVNDSEPEVFTEHLRDISFQEDGEAYTIAFAPEGTDLPPPRSIPQLERLTAV